MQYRPLALEPPRAIVGVGESTLLRGTVSVWPRDGGTDPRARDIAEARRLMANDRAASSRDKYERSWAAFVNFVAEREPAHAALPAHPAVVGLYVGSLRARGLAKRTILVHLAAIAYGHELAGAPAPWTLSVDLKREIRGLRRDDESARAPGKAIERERAAEILATIGSPTSPIDTRDYAIFCLGWLSAMRRANLAALCVVDVAFRRDPLDGRRYLDIVVRRSKTDQEGRGRRIAIPELIGAHPLCAVRAIERWLAVAVLDGVPLVDVPEAPLFPSFSLSRSAEQRKLTGHQLAGEDVRRVIKRLLVRAGVDATSYSPHSLRRGFATTMQDHGVPDALAMEMGGWKDKATYNSYKRVDKTRKNAVRSLFG